MNEETQKFVPGLKLGEIFYKEVISPILKADFPELKYSAGLIGEGSEILGYDTPQSTDHCWGPRIMLFLSANDYEKLAKKVLETLTAKIPAEFILPNDVYCGLQLCPSSPWSIQILDKGFGLFYGKRFVFTVSFVPRPRFYGTYLSDGKTLCEKVGVLYGSKYILSFFTRGYCYFFSINKQCKFCSLNPTRKSIGKDNILFITPSLAQELTKIAFASNPDIQYVNHCSGTHQNNDLGLKFQIDVLRAVVSETPMGVKQHMLTMPPNNLGKGLERCRTWNH